MDNLKNKKFLVTGGAGFLGSHMGDLLLTKKAKVICLDDLSNKPPRIKGEIKYTPDVSFMRKMLRDEPKIVLRDGILKTRNYLEKLT